MKTNIIFSPTAWAQYMEWNKIDNYIFNKINDLIEDIQRNGLMKGIGKPEVLKHRKGYSRRINGEHRLVYGSDENKNLFIIACKGHYEDK